MKQSVSEYEMSVNKEYCFSLYEADQLIENVYHDLQALDGSAYATKEQFIDDIVRCMKSVSYAHEMSSIKLKNDTSKFMEKYNSPLEWRNICCDGSWSYEKIISYCREKEQLGRLSIYNSTLSRFIMDVMQSVASRYQDYITSKDNDVRI